MNGSVDQTRPRILKKCDGENRPQQDVPDNDSMFFVLFQTTVYKDANDMA